MTITNSPLTIISTNNNLETTEQVLQADKDLLTGFITKNDLAIKKLERKSTPPNAYKISAGIGAILLGLGIAIFAVLAVVMLGALIFPSILIFGFGVKSIILGIQLLTKDEPDTVEMTLSPNELKTSAQELRLGLLDKLKQEDKASNLSIRPEKVCDLEKEITNLESNKPRPASEVITILTKINSILSQMLKVLSITDAPFSTAPTNEKILVKRQSENAISLAANPNRFNYHPVAARTDENELIKHRTYSAR